MTTTAETIVAAVVGAFVGGSGLVGLVFNFIRRYIDRKLNARDSENTKRREQQLRRLEIEDEMEHALGRLLFWMHRAITSGHHNGEYDAAWDEYQNAERKKKALDREIVVHHEMK